MSNVIPVNENEKEIEKDKKIEYDYGYIYYIKDENYDRINDIKNCIGYTFYYNDENENQILLQTLNYDNIYYIDLTDENNLLYDSKEYENGYKNVEVGLEYQNDENNNIIISLDTEQKQQQIEKDFEINQSVEKVPDDKIRQEIAFGIVNNEIGLSDVVQQNDDSKLYKENLTNELKKAKIEEPVKPEKIEQPKNEMDFIYNQMIDYFGDKSELWQRGYMNGYILLKNLGYDFSKTLKCSTREDIYNDSNIKSLMILGRNLEENPDLMKYSHNDDEDEEEFEGGFLGGYRRNKKVNYFKNNNQKNKLKQNDRIKRIKRQHINL